MASNWLRLPSKVHKKCRSEMPKYTKQIMSISNSTDSDICPLFTVAIRHFLLATDSPLTSDTKEYLTLYLIFVSFALSYIYSLIHCVWQKLCVCFSLHWQQQYHMCTPHAAMCHVGVSLTVCCACQSHQTAPATPPCPSLHQQSKTQTPPTK